MRFNPLSILPICFLFLTAALPAQNHKYKSVEGKMSITFPAAFENDTTNSSDVKIVKISTTIGKQTFFASYTLHTTVLTERESLAMTSLESFTQATGGAITNQKSWKLKGEKGYIATIYLEEQDVQMQYQVILIGSHQYQLVVVAPKDSWNQKSTDRFLKSFKVLK